MQTNPLVRPDLGAPEHLPQVAEELQHWLARAPYRVRNHVLSVQAGLVREDAPTYTRNTWLWASDVERKRNECQRWLLDFYTGGDTRDLSIRQPIERPALDVRSFVRARHVRQHMQSWFDQRGEAGDVVLALSAVTIIVTLGLTSFGQAVVLAVASPVAGTLGKILKMVGGAL